MKRLFVSSAFLLAICTAPAFSQKNSIPPPPPGKEKEQNIIIRKKGDAKEKTTIVIDGDKVTINGKPMEDYKDGDIQVIENNGLTMRMPDLAPLPPMPAHGGANMFVRNFSDMQNEAFLGVSSSSSDGGAVVSSISKNSPAEKAGLKEGDVITKVGSNNIDDMDDLVEAIGKKKPQDKVTITYKRDKKENTATVTLDKNKAHAFVWNSDDVGARNNLMKNFVMNWNDDKPQLGVRAQDMENSSGIKVLELNDDDSPAAKAGLKADDVITSVNGKAVQTIKDIRDAMKDIKPGDTVAITYQRAGASQTASVHFPKQVETSDL